MFEALSSADAMRKELQTRLSDVHDKSSLIVALEHRIAESKAENERSWLNVDAIREVISVDFCIMHNFFWGEDL